MRRINQAGLDLIKSFEGLRLKAYDDGVGVWTIGYGHTGPEVAPGLEISEDQAEDLLRGDLATAEHGVEGAIGSGVNDNQFAACVSLAFNVGVGNFKGSTLAKRIRENHIADAANEFLKWNRAGGHVMPGLTRRREAERKLFLTPVNAMLSSSIDPPIEECAPEASSTPTTQVVVAPTTATDTAQIAAIQAVQAAGEAPIQATTAGPKSLWTTIIGGISALPAAIWGLLQGNAEAIKWALIVAGAVVIVYLLRLLVLDVMRNYAAMRPDRHNVK